MNLLATDIRTGNKNLDGGRNSLHRLVEPFAAAIFATVEAHRTFGAALPPAYAKRLMDSIFDDIRGAAAVHKHRVSQAAATEAHRRGIDRLSAKTWKDQSEFDPGGRVFVVEHLVSIPDLVCACMFQATHESVEDVLVRRLGPVWLLRYEHDALAAIGLRARLRVAGSCGEVGGRAQRDALYRYAGIVLPNSYGA